MQQVSPFPFRFSSGPVAEPAPSRLPAGGVGSGQPLCYGCWFSNVHGEVPGEAVLPHGVLGQHDHR